MTTYADVVAATLADAGIEYIFGVPGSLSSVELIEAAAKRGIRYILTSNESSAAVMAGTYGIMRNRPGVVSTGVGPGAAAVVHGVAQLFMERAPTLILTDRYGETEFRRLPRQRLEQEQLFRPVVKATLKLSALDAARTMQRAIDLAMEGRPGPVHIDMPYDVMLAEASADDMPEPDDRRRFFAQTSADSTGLQALAAAIESSTRPALIVGQQVGRRGEAAEGAFAGLVVKLGVPVFASLGAKGTLPEQHALAAGTFRGTPGEKTLLQHADLLVMVGFDPVEIFTPGVWLYDAPVVTLDEVPYGEGPYKPSIEVVANLENALPALTSMVSNHGGWNREDIDAYKQGTQAVKSTATGLLPATVIQTARRHLPDNGILTVDAGQHKVVTSDLWQTRRTRGFFSSSGLGTMAVSIPAAIAAKLVEPTTPVLCFVGDGGFIMRAGDLEICLAREPAHRHRRVQRPRAQPDQAAAGPARLQAPGHVLRRK